MIDHKDNRGPNTGSLTTVDFISNGLQSSKLRKLFEEELNDIYQAEKALTKALPGMIKKSSSPELIEALSSHLAQTIKQLKRVEQVFESMEQKASAEKCEVMEGLINECEAIMKECEEGPRLDAGILNTTQKAWHYELATYGILRQFAETLGLKDASTLLKETLEEGKVSETMLTEIAVSAVNIAVATAEV